VILHNQSFSSPPLFNLKIPVFCFEKTGSCAFADAHLSQKSTTASYLPTTVFIKKTVAKGYTTYMAWSKTTAFRKKTVAAQMPGMLQRSFTIVAIISLIASLQETVVLRKKTVSGKTFFISPNPSNTMYYSIINLKIINNN